jgi:pilus assembly protein CpaD
MHPNMLAHPVRSFALLGMLALSGCSADTVAGRAPLSDPVAPKQNMVALASFDHDIHFANGSTILAPGEAQSLDAFLRNSAIGDSDDVTIGLSTGDSAALAAARQASVLAALRHLHVPVLPASDRAQGRNAIRLRVARYVVTPPRCPDWSKPEVDEPTNSRSSNFGCANETSLALMVANPRDLLHGTPAAGADGEALAHGVALYRSGALSKSLAASGGATSAGGAGGGAGGGGQ